MSITLERPRVLLTNDDGPPGMDSPYIFGFAHHLAIDLGWDVKVVIPSSQKSWIGKAYHIKEITKGRYFYTRDPDGIGETSTFSRPLKVDEGEFAEWILLDGVCVYLGTLVSVDNEPCSDPQTPATCANIALHNIYKDKIDLVISGPNFGRNSSAAFALSSGTIGAALSSSLSHCRSIALSYGTVQRPVPPGLFKPAHRLAGRIIQGLWRKWGMDAGSMRNGEVDLYNVNIPMVDALLSDGGMRVVWTTIWRNAYGRLFKAHALDPGNVDKAPAGGPDAQLSKDKANLINRSEDTNMDALNMNTALATNYAPELVFEFAPDMRGLIGPNVVAPVGSDAWAIERGWASVTPLRASFAEPPVIGLSAEGVSYAGLEEDVGAQGVRLFKL